MFEKFDKHMKKHLLTCFLLIAVNTLIAQRPKFKWGPIQESKNTQDFGSIGGNKNGYYSTGSAKHGWWIFGNWEKTINKYDMKHELVSTREYYYKMGKEKLKFTGDGFFINNNLHVFASKYNSKKDVNKIYKKTFNADLSEESEWEEFEEIASKKEKNANAFNFIRSEDESKVMLYINNPEDKKKKKESVTYKVYDNNLKKLWEKELEFEFDDKKFLVSNYSITNNGQVVLLGKKNLNKKDAEKGKPNYKYVIFLYDNDKNALEQFDVSLGTNYINDISYTIDNDNKKLLITGFYANKNTGTLSGVFYQRIDMVSKTVEIENTKEFERDFLLDHLKESKVDKNKEISNHYDIRQLVRRDDGGLVMVAEYYMMYVTSTTTRNGNTSTTTYTYHYYYNDIILFNIDKDGKIGWSVTVPKIQYSTNDGGYYSSYLLSVEKDKMIFLYYDNEENFNKNSKKKSKNRLKIEVKSMTNIHKAVLAMAVVDYDGNLSREIVMKSRKERKLKSKDPIFIPKETIVLEGDNILVKSILGSYYQYGFLTFEGEGKNDGDDK
jgi:hypothetical protein